MTDPSLTDTRRRRRVDVDGHAEEVRFVWTKWGHTIIQTWHGNVVTLEQAPSSGGKEQA